jgi:hypothetical protein
MRGGIFSLPLFPFTDANADERSKIDTSEEHSRDLHASHEERERERRRENLFGAGNEREFDIARNELFQLGRTSSETHTHPSSSFSSIFIVWLLLLCCVCSLLIEPSTSHRFVNCSSDEKEREISNMES